MKDTNITKTVKKLSSPLEYSLHVDLTSKLLSYSLVQIFWNILLIN